MILGWLKNKAASTCDLEACIDYLSHDIPIIDRAMHGSKTAMLISVGLTRITTEGMPPSFFQETYKNAKNEAMTRHALRNVRHEAFAVPYIAMTFFKDLQLSDTENGRKGLVLIINYLDKYAAPDIVKSIKTALGIVNG